MRIIKIPVSAGWLKKTTGVEKATEKIVQCLDSFWFSETGFLHIFSFEEVEVPTQENIVNKIKSEEGQFILLGGDHSLTYPAFKGFALNHKKNPGIIVFDAHPDLMSVTEPVNHENYLRALIDQNIIKK